MWHECPTEQDEPITLQLGSFSVELGDFAISIGLFLCIYLLFRAPGIGALLAIPYVLGVSYFKRGKPPGIIWQWLHYQEFLRIPGACRPYPRSYSAL